MLEKLEVVQEQITAVCEAVKELRRVLLESALMEEYQKAVAPLDQEAGKITAEIQVLSNARDELKPRLGARQRLLAIEIDQCVAVGDDQGAVARRREVEELAKSLSELGNKIDQHGARLTAIGSERSRLAKEVFLSAYPAFPKATFALLEVTVDLLDALKQGMFDYTQATGISGDFPDQLPKQYHVSGLTPNELPGSDRALSRRLDNWFGPVRR